MRIDNPFDKKLEIQTGIPEEIRAGLITVTDTLDICWASAQSVFEGKAKPEHALTICQLVLAEVERNRNR